MLILRRREGEALLIGTDVEIEFLELTSQAVKIGIKAPREVSILRKELHLTQIQNLAAANGADFESVVDRLKKIS